MGLKLVDLFSCDLVSTVCLYQQWPPLIRTINKKCATENNQLDCTLLFDLLSELSENRQVNAFRIYGHLKRRLMLSKFPHCSEFQESCA